MDAFNLNKVVASVEQEPAEAEQTNKNKNKKGEWTTVLKGKGRNARVVKTLESTFPNNLLPSTALFQAALAPPEPESEPELSFISLLCASRDLMKQIENSRAKMDETTRSGFYHSFIGQLLEAFKALGSNFATNRPSKIVCFGLGNFSTSLQARYQLVLLWKLKQQLKVPVEVFDPIFTLVERHTLWQYMDISVLNYNEMGCRVVDSNTIFYMPHCSHQLTNNLLYANWKPLRLPSLIIISNSIKSICERGVTSLDKEEGLEIIERSSQTVLELPIENNFVYNDVFNDSSIHVFPKEKVQEMDPSYWEVTSPKYCELDFVADPVGIDKKLESKIQMWLGNA